MLDGSGAVLATLATYSNLNDVSGYAQHTFAWPATPARRSS